MLPDFDVKLIQALIGIFAGMLVAGGMFAFVTMIGVVTRMAGRTKTNSCAGLYEDMVVLGATVGNVLFFYSLPFFRGVVWQIGYGFFSGIYIGCLSVALAEMLNVVPVFSRRIRLKKGLGAFIIAFSLGKLAGGILDFFF